MNKVQNAMAFGIIALMLVSGATLMTDSDVTYANGGGGGIRLPAS